MWRMIGDREPMGVGDDWGQSQWVWGMIGDREPMGVGNDWGQRANGYVG